jgi:hypothetical protein
VGETSWKFESSRPHQFASPDRIRPVASGQGPHSKKNVHVHGVKWRLPLFAPATACIGRRTLSLHISRLSPARSLSNMRISLFATAIFAASAIFALSASAQTTATPSKQPTQGLPSSMGNPQYGDSAHRQKAQGVPVGTTGQQCGGAAAKQKTSGVPASLDGSGQYGAAQKQQ